MKVYRFFQPLFIFAILIFTQTARAQEAEQTDEDQPPVYTMQLIWLADGDNNQRDGEYIFLIGDVGFKTVSGLKNFVASLPRGSRLEWSPGCLRRGGEPLLSSAEELEDFKSFCAERGVEFILHPSG